MTHTPDQFLNQLKDAPQKTDFHECIAMINNHYDYTPSGFHNGIGEDRISNEAGTNEGSCKIFAFAKNHNLDKDQTLACFGNFYRIDVLQNSDSSDHANIRTFMRYGWEGIEIEATVLTPKNP